MTSVCQHSRVGDYCPTVGREGSGFLNRSLYWIVLLIEIIHVLIRW